MFQIFQVESRETVTRRVESFEKSKAATEARWPSAPPDNVNAGLTY